MSVLEQLVDQRVSQTFAGSIGVATERIAEEIARETLQDETFRRMLRELVQRRSTELLEALLAPAGRARGGRGSGR